MPSPLDSRGPPALHRCWLFLPGADRRALLEASTRRADVLIQELEDFTPPEQRPEVRAMAAEIYSI
jgi:citrate lyase subunit beta / citryl-CoA lyase